MDAELTKIVEQVWQRLIASAGNPAAEWGLVTLATVDADGSPHQRTIVLRSADPQSRSLCGYADRRSAKVAQLAANPRSSWLFYDRQDRLQATFTGTAEVQTTGAIVERAWAECRAGSRQNYLGLRPPGSPRDLAAPSAPDSGEPALAADGSHYFSVVTATVTQLDWLQLLPAGNLRARFWWDSEHWQGHWVHP